MATGYSKIFKSIFDSSIWVEAPTTRYLWMVMLVMAEKDGIIEASLPGLVMKTGLTREQVLEGLKTLSSPDPDSRTKEYNGVRIAETESGGWKILNFDAYKERMSRADRKEYLRVKQAEFRQKKKEEAANPEATDDDDGYPNY
jgi:hypothetical protein